MQSWGRYVWSSEVRSELSVVGGRVDGGDVRTDKRDGVVVVREECGFAAGREKGKGVLNVQDADKAYLGMAHQARDPKNRVWQVPRSSSRR